MRQLRLPMRIWDMPTRLFHWALVLLIAASWVTQRGNWMQWHVLVGSAMLTMLLFRVAWGFLGSDTSRFRQFVKSPAVAIRYLAHFNRREPDNEIGHNAAGGWMVLIMLTLLLIQATTGLFSNDDIDTEGPLMSHVGKEMSDRFSHIHAINFILIETAIALHLLAIAGYAVVKGQNLVRPMVTGKKLVPGAVRAPRMVSPMRAVLVLIVCGVAVWALIRYGS